MAQSRNLWEERTTVWVEARGNIYLMEVRRGEKEQGGKRRCSTLAKSLSE
ncbi:MAG: hypothetical protein N2V73_01135 [Candidatus Methanospirare jalkutatii]|nr:hypothetical protein [Candidatus Methanospirare jalkutatii]MCW7080343.1 hypothetical protein [Candidatus Methanospirare jalkutatii]